MLLIYPPVAKPCEPPAGITRLAGSLRDHGIACTTIDSNMEGLLFLLSREYDSVDTWTRRAARNLPSNLLALRSEALYTNPARYYRAVTELNRLLDIAGKQKYISLSLTNYQDNHCSPHVSADLLAAAAHPGKNIFSPYFSARFQKIFEETSFASVGISLNYLSQAPCTFALIGVLKKIKPDLQIILGGGLITSWMSNPSWQNPFGALIDHLVQGSGENALLNILNRTIEKHNSTPDYTDLPVHSYLAPHFILPFSASQGCYWNKCSFCPEIAEKNPYSAMKPATILRQVASLKEKTSPGLLHFLDNAVSPALMDSLIAAPPGIPWYGFARINRALTDPAYCLALRQSGCVMLKLGLESGDQGVLETMHKGIDINMASQVLTSLKQAGIGTYIYLLFGTPAESIVEARRTLQFIVDHNKMVTFLNLAIFNMPVCAPDAHTLAVKGQYEGDLTLYTDFHHPRNWHRRLVRQFLDHEFKRHPAVASILRRDPPHFTSNHASFFCREL